MSAPDPVAPPSEALVAVDPVVSHARASGVRMVASPSVPAGYPPAPLLAQADLQAAEAALRAGQARTALTFLDAAAATLPVTDLLARSHHLRAQALLMSGETDEAQRYLAMAIRVAVRAGQADVQAEALNLRAQIEHGRGDSLLALATLETAQRLRAEHGDVAGEIRSACNRALIQIALGQHAEALEILQWALQRLPGSQTPLVSDLYVHSNLGLLLEGMERLDEAAGHYLHARDSALAADDLAAHATMSLNAGEIFRKLGRPDAADLLGAALRAADDLGLPRVRAGALHSLGLLHSGLGDHDAADRYLLQAEELAQTSSDLDAHLEATLGRAKNWLASGRRDLAQRGLHHALKLATEGTRPQAAYDAHLLLADAHEGDDPRASLHHLRQATALERDQRALALAQQAQALARDARLNSARLDAEHERQLRTISDQARMDAEAKVQAQVEELERGRLRDSVTGLPNRLLLRVLIGQDIREQRPHSLVILDFDRFRGITDTLGEAASDELLRQVAGRLEGLLGSGETLARVSSDVFAVLIRGEHESAVLNRRARQFMDAFTSEFSVGSAEVVISASIGVAHFPQHARDADDLLRAAHVAAREATEGGGIQVYSPHLPSAGGRSAVLSMESGLARALERREFELHFQPLVDAAGGQVVTAEALLRWNSAALGRRSPAEFIPLLERSGLIVPVGDWVLREACRQAAAWDGVRVAVNLSARQFMGGGLAESVRRALAESGLPAERLELEITESLMMQSPERAVRLLSELKRTGVRVVLDDFGTGFSNLSYLHTFPLDGLKIDRSFVVALGQSERAGSIIAAIVQMGHALGLDVVAEGIETSEQHGALRRLGVPVLQGYLFGRPQARWRP
ncbi:hypothetical protein CVO96_18955 [Deinococcus koreensis]|uniref:GGDEF-domain containing protein n=1 Tax=Deinococcus koreensis TaxID=2054903 RepID=A0A2K3USJ1_9DEIO|nr:hypothetical protein CVO96_18955 [Deinococcus koreensis]